MNIKEIKHDGVEIPAQERVAKVKRGHLLAPMRYYN